MWELYLENVGVRTWEVSRRKDESLYIVNFKRMAQEVLGFCEDSGLIGFALQSCLLVFPRQRRWRIRNREENLRCLKLRAGNDTPNISKTLAEHSESIGNQQKPPGKDYNPRWRNSEGDPGTQNILPLGCSS